MKRFLKILGVIVVLLIFAVGCLLAYLRFGFPKVSPADQTLKIERTPERIARGEYLANNVMDCFGCHGMKAMDEYTFPLKEGTKGAGGFRIPREWKFFPGDVTAPNITPHGIGSWTDGEVLRAMTAGVARDGRVLFPMRSYQDIAKLDREDVYSLIAYIRTLPSIAVDQRKTEIDFPLNLILRTLPKDPQFGHRPDGSNEVESGKYLVGAVGCMVCHTVVDKQETPIGDHFAGGRVFDLPPIPGVIRSVNITPDTLTGIGSWSREVFIKVIRERGAKAGTKVAKGEANTVMPYGVLAHMTDQDLGAIYAYLRTIPAIKNSVKRWEPRPI